MKRLLWAAILLLAPAAHAITYQSVRASTSTTLTPTIQAGTMNLSSGTVTNMTHTNLTTQFLTVNSTASFVGVTGSTISYSSATFTNLNVTGTGTIATLNTSNGNVTLTTAAITGVSGSTITYSSATFTNVNVTGTATVGALSGGTISGTTGSFSSSVNVTGTMTVASSVTINNAVRMGSAGNAVVISSNVVMPGTTFYAGGVSPVINGYPFSTWTTYNPTLPSGCFGTTTNSSFFYKQVGDTVHVKGAFKCGTVGASACTISLPIAVNFSKMPNPTTSTTLFGFSDAVRASMAVHAIFGDGSDTANAYLGNAASVGSGMTKGTGTALYDNNDYVLVDFTYAQ